MMLNKAYWQGRYQAHNTGWDLGGVSPPIAAYADQLERKDLRILIPGAGHGYEAEYLWQQGHRDLTVLDIAPLPLSRLRERLPGDFPEDRLVEGDFFRFQGGPFDLVLEHTFFCALPPSLRPKYVQKMAALLRPGGTLAGLLFDFPLTEEGPPFGGSQAEYTALFRDHFDLRLLKRARNSIPPRAGRELFFIFEKK